MWCDVTVFFAFQNSLLDNMLNSEKSLGLENALKQKFTISLVTSTAIDKNSNSIKISKINSKFTKNPQK